MREKFFSAFGLSLKQGIWDRSCVPDCKWIFLPQGIARYDLCTQAILSYDSSSVFCEIIGIFRVDDTTTIKLTTILHVTMNNAESLENKGFRRCYLASQKGFEPPTPRLGGVCSIQLSYCDMANLLD